MCARGLIIIFAGSNFVFATDVVYIYAFIGRLFIYPYLMYRTRGLMPDKWTRLFYGVLLGEFAFSTLTLLIHSYVMHPLMSQVMSLGLFVFFSAGYATALVVALNILKRLWRLAGGRSGVDARSRLRIERGIALGALGVFVATMLWGYRNVYDLHVERRTLTIGETVEAKPKRHLRLVLITDLHIGEGITPGYVERVVERTLSEQPDIVLVGGDYIDHHGKYAYTPEVMAMMRRLASAPQGVYYVPGNHEYRADSTAKLDWVRQVGGVLLRDSVVYPRGEGDYALIGRDDYVQYGRKPLSELVPGTERAPLVILLEHTPEELSSLEGTPIGLALYGHTHGGQLFPNHISVWLKYGITSGVMRLGDTELYVSSGAGAAGAPYRIGTRSEIVVYDIDY